MYMEGGAHLCNLIDGNIHTAFPSDIIFCFFTEITRDSSSERGNSFDVSEDELDTSVSSKGKHSNKKQTESPKNKRSPRDKNEKEITQTSNTESEMSEEQFRKSVEKDIVPSDHAQTNGYESLDSSFDSSRTLTSKNDSPRSVSNTQRKRPTNGVQSDHDANANKVIRDNSPVRTSKRDDIPLLDLNGCDDRSDVDSISGEINPPIDDNRVRLFVALFDYDPETMSPNTDALDEELPFKEGQIIKVNNVQKITQRREFVDKKKISFSTF